MKTVLTVLGCLFMATTAFSAHHEASEPQVAELYDCTLNEGVTAGDVAALGAGDFAAFAEKHELNMTSFLWEAIAVNPPYQDRDVRWVNYFPTWGDYFTGEASWREHGSKVAAKINKLVTCAKPSTWSVHSAGEEAPAAAVKPLYIRVCNLKEGNTMKNALAYRKAVNRVQNGQIEGSVGSYVFTPGFGASGFDYAAMVTGTPEDMTALFENSRNGSTAALLTEAGMAEPSNCTVDLHKSHMMVN